MKLGMLLMAVLAGIGSHSALAQSTDVSGQIQALLNSLGAVPYTHAVSRQVPQTYCHCSPNPSHTCFQVCETRQVNVTSTQTDQVIPTALNIRVIRTSPVQFNPLETTSFPDQLSVDRREFVNCSHVTVQQSITLQVAFQRSASLALSQSITNSTSYQLGFQWKPTDAFTFSGQATLGTSETKGSVDTSGTQMTITRSSQAGASLTSGQAIVALIEVWPITYSQVFHSSAVLDADLSPNDKYHHLSDVVQDESKRTFPITGTISITDASDGRESTYDAPDETTVCTAADQGVKEVKVPASKSLILVKQPDTTTKIEPKRNENR